MGYFFYAPNPKWIKRGSREMRFLRKRKNQTSPYQTSMLKNTPTAARKAFSSSKGVMVSLLVFLAAVGLFFGLKMAFGSLTYKAFYQLNGDYADAINGYDLTASGSPSFTTGKYGQGLQTYTSPQSYAEIIGTDMGITGNSGLSMGGWFKITSQPSGTFYTLISRGNSDDGAGNDRRVYYWIAYRDVGGTKKLYFSRTRRAVEDVAFEYTYTLQTDVWYHLALTYNYDTGGSLRGYLNAAEVGNASSTGNGNGPAQTHFAIGILDNYDSYLYPSNIVADDVFISEQVFSPGDLSNTMGGLSQDSVAVDFPENSTSTPISDFTHWEISGTFASSTDALKTKMYYTCGTCPLTWVDNHWQIFETPVDDFALSIPKGHLLTASSTREWWVYAETYNYYTSDFMASSTKNYFRILGTEQPPPTSTPTSTYFITCDPNSGFFTYSFCSMFAYLLVPDPAALNQFSELAEGIKYKPPIGYFYAIADVLGGIEATSTQAFTLPEVEGLTDYIFDPFKTALTWILWLLFSFWIFNRIRHLDI